MEDLHSVCIKLIREAIDRFLYEQKEVLKSLPERYLQQLPLLKSEATLTHDIAFQFGEASDLAFVLQHGSHDFPALRFTSWLDQVVGEQVTRLIEESMP